MQRIDIHALAIKAGVCAGTVRKHISGLRPSSLLAGLPAPVARGTKLLWLDSDIDCWLADQSTLTTTTNAPAPVTHQATKPTKRGRGRPKKLTQAQQ